VRSESGVPLCERRCSSLFSDREPVDANRRARFVDIANGLSDGGRALSGARFRRRRMTTGRQMHMALRFELFDEEERGDDRGDR
jgi:hypothetical protein